MPNFPAMFILNQAIRYLIQIGVPSIENSLLPLVRAAYQGLSNLGLRLLTPPSEEFWSGIVSFASDNAEMIGKSLAASGIITWYGDGRVRASIHLYNDMGDIERFLDGLRGVLNHAK